MRRWLLRRLPDPGRRRLRRRVLPVRDLRCLMIAMGWNLEPRLDLPHLARFDYLEDLNERRLRDAEAIAAACRNAGQGHILEIGTAHGETTLLMALNAPEAAIHTINIPPEDIAAGGRHVTFAPAREEIGRAWRERGFANIRQILANTATWEPDIPVIDVAFIDGCHDSDFVFSDTVKVLSRCRSGSIILWHDFAPELADAYPWISSVCLGVRQLYDERILTGPILHLRDSWVGVYRVP